jgi:hypothetical protein
MALEGVCSWNNDINSWELSFFFIKRFNSAICVFHVLIKSFRCSIIILKLGDWLQP